MSVSFGEDTAYEEETKIVVKGTSEIDGSEVTKEFTYKRDKEPVIGAASEGFSLRIPKKDFPFAWDIADYVSNGNRPHTIEKIDDIVLKDVIIQSWCQQPKERVSIQFIVSELEKIISKL